MESILNQSDTKKDEVNEDKVLKLKNSGFSQEAEVTLQIKEKSEGLLPPSKARIWGNLKREFIL